MRNKMKRFGKSVLLPAMAATIMTMASVSTKVYAAGGDGGGTAAVTKPLDNLKTCPDMETQNKVAENYLAKMDEVKVLRYKLAKATAELRDIYEEGC